MKATELDQEIACPVCQNSNHDFAAYDGTCPRCDNTGVINRYRDGDDGEVILAEAYEETPQGSKHRVQRMAVQDEDSGGWEGYFSDFSPSDPTTGAVSNYPWDKEDQALNNPLGTNTNDQGEYELTRPDGTVVVVTASDFPGGTWPDPDMTVDEARAWMAARGEKPWVDLLDKLKNELGL